jgi:glycosyltransferase involved in cell wall biosynthesis
VRVVQLIPSLAVGGLERVATTLTLALHARDVRVLVCTAGAWEHTTLVDALTDARVPIATIPRPRPEPRLFVRSVHALARVLRRERPDVLHAHNPAAALAARLAATLAGRPRLPIVTTFHGLVSDRRGLALAFRLGSDVVVGVSEPATEGLIESGVPRHLCRTILNGVDATPSRTREDVRAEFGAEDAELVVAVGRYTHEKNHALLVDALGRLGESRPRLRALIVGTGRLAAALREQAAAVGLADRVTVTGPRADAIDIIAAADVLVQPSSREALGLSLAEAQTVGTPVVATAVGGVPSIVRDEHTGLLVPPGDVDALAAAIDRLLDDAGLRARLAAEAQAFARTAFSIDTMTDAYLDAYARAISVRTRDTARRTGASRSK